MRPFWRFASPSTLLLALMLFPMPWIEMRCSAKKGGSSFLGKLGLPDTIGDALQGREEGEAMYRQSGWQSAWGEWSRSREWQEALRNEEVAERALWLRFEKELTLAMTGSWLMAVYPIALLAGAVTGMLMRQNARRVAVVAILSGAALALVVVQVASEFPLVQAYRDLAWERVEARPPSPKETEASIPHWFRYTRWFWLAQGLAIASLVLLAAEWWLCPPETKVDYDSAVQDL
jgi:hypothetical protein